MSQAERNSLSCSAVLALLASIASGGVHLDSVQNVAWNWVLDDGAGYRWDITPYGTVNDGSDDAYDGAMQLEIDRAPFSYGRPGMLSQDAREVEIGPWRHGTLLVYRRIYVDPGLGYCRWIDLYENGSDQPISANVTYSGNLGGSVRTLRTSSGKDRLSPGDWGLITADASPQRPAIVHVFASPGGQLRPDVQIAAKGRDISYSLKLEVPPQRTVALCFFHAQRRPFADAESFLRDFSPGKELVKVPSDLRRLIVNMGAPMMSLGGLDLPRHGAKDMLVLSNGGELLGRLRANRFAVRTFYTSLDLPAARVLGFRVLSPGSRCVRMGLVDGQVISGDLADEPVGFDLAGGDAMSVSLNRLKCASYCVSPDRPVRVARKGWELDLRDGQRLRLRAAPPSLEFLTRHGPLTLQSDEVSKIRLDVTDGGLHEVIFRNASRLSGFLATDSVRLTLELGGETEIPRARLRSLTYADPPSSTDEAPVHFLLRNGDRLYGRLEIPTLSIRTRSGEVRVRPEQAERVEFRDEFPEAARVTLRDGSILDGRLTLPFLTLRISAGVAPEIYIGHIERIEFAAPSEGE
jgi:hypothetical protein